MTTTPYPRHLINKPWRVVKHVATVKPPRRHRRMYFGGIMFLLIIAYAKVIAVILQFYVVFALALAATAWTVLVTVGWALTAAVRAVVLPFKSGKTPETDIGDKHDC